MEAVPRLPMISFQLKVSLEPTAFGAKLKQYIRDFYNEDPESYNSEIHQLESLRNMVVRPPLDMAGCLLLKKYYCQLHFLQSRFPMGKDGAAAVTFTWRDTYANMVCSLATIKFEMISILYNIGSMHTQLGARTERTSADGMKMACAHFQCAAWAFEHLKNSYPQPSGIDMAPELMTFMHQLCLAQAQECILEKSMLDNRKPTIVAKVARQIVDYYTQALTTLEQGGSEDGTISDTVGTKIYKMWKRYVKFKKAYHLAVTHLYQGLAAEEQRKMGERVAFYNAASASLEKANQIYNNSKGSKGITGPLEEKTAVEEALVFTNDVIEGKRKAAKNENEFIYHEEVPEIEALPSVKGASLVKGISFNINDPEVSGPDIFARLVPMKVHEASSLYSEEKAKILRSVVAKIEEKDQQLNSFLAFLKLEHMNLWDPDIQATDWERLPLPDDLVERCAALNAKQHIIDELVDVMEKLTETSQDVEKILKEINKILQDEELKEKQYQDAVGKRPPSIVATDLTREAKKYEEAHNKASESNHTLHKAIMMHVKNLKILAQPLADLNAHIPSPSTSLNEQNTEKSQSAIELDRMHTKELKRILSKVDEMRRQRGDLLTKLRESISQDDLTRLLVTATSDSGPLDRLFADQLSKHQSLVNLIDQNLVAQENILSALTNAYAQTANVRKTVEEALKRRELVISSLMASYDAVDDLSAKANKGLEFYRKLEINVSKLLQRVKSTCKVQDEEREQILAQDKTSQGKVEAPITSTYEQTRSRTGSGLKLKDYLNSRLDGSYQTQTRSIHMDGATKSYTADTVDKSILPSASLAGTADVGSSIAKPTQQYYSANYTEYKPNVSYSYGMHTYSENSKTAVNQSYMQSGASDMSTPYHQTAPMNSTANMTNQTMQYSTNSYPSDSQIYSTAAGMPDRYTTQYNLPESMPYKTYPAAADYQGYNTMPQYSTPMDKTATMPQSEIQEMQPQIQPISQMPASNPSSNITVMDPSASQLYTGQQYIPETQQNVLPQDTNQSMVNQQHGMPAGDASQVQNYTMPQANQAEMSSSQNYSGAYYTPMDLHSQQAMSHQNVTGPTNTTGSTQYIPAHYMSTSNNGVNAPSTEVTNSYTTNVQQPNAVQYVQQGTADLSTQVPYHSYGTQIAINNTSLSYPSTYSVQQATPAVTYQANNYQSTEASGSYGYMNCPTPEIIQSHAKATTVPGYTQNYQYNQQNDYSGYPSYNYMPENQMANTMTEPYNAQAGYAYTTAAQAQPYQYNLQNSQPPQTGQISAVSQVNTATTNVYYQQDSNPTYTNASSNTAVNQTPSSQYSNQSYTPQPSSDTYYTTPYGLQMQGQTGATSKTETYTNYNQTYMQAVNNGTNTTTSANPVQSTTKSGEKSNVDLLSDLDVTINHAPLVPEVKPLNKPTEDSATNDVEEKESEKEKNNVNEQIKTETAASIPEDRTEMENLKIVWDTWYNDVQPKKDPLGEPVALQKFITEVEKYEKFVDSLLVKTLSGATNLDIKWKEVQDSEARESGKQSCTVALAHSSENRVMECIPYDTTRVQISSSDVPNYINASHIMEITQRIPTAFIITQTPLPDKLDVFWTMIWEQESEVIACLASDVQLNGEIYWPVNEENILTAGNFTISLKKRVNHVSYIQRIISIYHVKKKCEKTVVHMQFLAWPSNGFPSSPGPLLAFSTDVMSEQALRRCSPKPVIVHCIDGGSLSSLFLVAAATVCHIRAGCGIIDVPLVFKGLVKCRKQVVNKESMLFAYRLVLYHAQDSLMKRGILSSSRSTFENFEGLKGNRDKAARKMHHPSDDFLQTLGVGGHRSDADKQGKKVTGSGSATNSTSIPMQDKSKEKAIDPLSQLDPLWSIRR